MAIRVEEERLGAFRLFPHFLRIMGYVRGRSWLLILCVAGSMVQVGVELSLPLLMRRGIDTYILPPFLKVDVASPGDTSWLEAKPDYFHVPGQGHSFIRASELSRAERAELDERRLIAPERYYERALGRLSAAGKGGVAEGDFFPESAVRRMDSTDRKAVLEPHRREVFRLAVWYLTLICANFALSYGVALGLNHLGQKAVAVMRGSLFRHLHRLPIRYFDENPVGRLVTRVNNDTAALSALFTEVVATAVSDVALFAGIVVLLFLLDARLTACLLMLAPPLIVLSLWFKVISQKIYREIRVQLAEINTFLQESVQGIGIIKSFQFERGAIGRFASLGLTYYRTQMRLIYVFAIFRPLIDVFATSGIAVVIWYGGGQALQNQLSIGTLVAFLMYLKMLFMPLQDLAEKFDIVQSGVVASERLFRILDTPADDQGAGKIPVSSCGHVTFENVSFAYEEEQPILEGVSFEVPCGQTVALVGPTGSGKTTITALLLRFYDLRPGQGRILVDGLPIKEWDLGILRRLFAFVPQDLFLFADTLRNNVTLFRAIEPERIRRALEVSRAQMVVSGLQGGLDHPLNERATTLSQGERQLVSFARALVSDAKVLVLDEATASIDSQTEALIQQALKALLAGRTALVVAHRLSTVRSADKILVLKKGRIVEKGTHAELIRRGGLYSRLYDAQFARARHAEESGSAAS
jgi:ATP-binding cassette subfamily B multidrug efflux pump